MHARHGASEARVQVLIAPFHSLKPSPCVGLAVRLACDEMGSVEGCLVCVVPNDLLNMASSKQVINRLCITPFLVQTHAVLENYCSQK